MLNLHATTTQEKGCKPGQASCPDVLFIVWLVNVTRMITICLRAALNIPAS